MIHYGERRPVVFATAASQLVIVVTTFLRMNNRHQRSMSGRCHEKVDDFYNFNPQLLTASNFLFILLEMGIYANLSQFVYHMDTEVRAHISEQAFKRRKRKNAIDLVGHIAHFVLESANLVLEGICQHTMKPSLLIVGMIMYMCVSGLISILLIALSPALKNECRSLFWPLLEPLRIKLINKNHETYLAKKN